MTGGVLGLFAGAPFRCGQAQLRPGDLMFAYTDGVNEAKDEAGEQFSDERILAGNAGPEQAAAEFLDAMHRRILAFRGGAAQSDDITMIAVRRLK